MCHLDWSLVEVLYEEKLGVAATGEACESADGITGPPAADHPFRRSRRNPPRRWSCTSKRSCADARGEVVHQQTALLDRQRLAIRLIAQTLLAEAKVLYKQKFLSRCQRGNGQISERPHWAVSSCLFISSLVAQLAEANAYTNRSEGYQGCDGPLHCRHSEGWRHEA